MPFMEARERVLGGSESPDMEKSCDGRRCVLHRHHGDLAPLTQIFFSVYLAPWQKADTHAQCL